MLFPLRTAAPPPRSFYLARPRPVVSMSKAALFFVNEEERRRGRKSSKGAKGAEGTEGTEGAVLTLLYCIRGKKGGIGEGREEEGRTRCVGQAGWGGAAEERGEE